VFFWLWGFVEFLCAFPLALAFLDDGFERPVLEFTEVGNFGLLLRLAFKLVVPLQHFQFDVLLVLDCFEGLRAEAQD
jgi:hypothetical protein